MEVSRVQPWRSVVYQTDYYRGGEVIWATITRELSVVPQPRGEGSE